ncbi:MAG: hypothetical protein M3N07_05130 [Pseudomonadota bacterium]|nr:hypothetical protein [Pseudomonadota bacterium]
MQKVTHDAATALLRAIQAAFAPFGIAFTLHEMVSRGWSSVTFVGARHRMLFSLAGARAGEAADAFLAALGDPALDLRGHILADLALLGEERAPGGGEVRIRIEGLTVEDG